MKQIAKLQKRKVIESFEFINFLKIKIYIYTVGCCDKHKNAVGEEGGILEAKPDENDPSKTENVGYFRRVGRYFKSFFTWSSENE